MNNLNYNEKLSLLHNLLKLTRVDHIESEMEVDFIYRIGEKLNIDPTDVDKLLKQPIDFQPPKEENRRIVLFYTFLLVMGIDGHFSSEEVVFCEEIGFKLGLNPLAVKSLLQKMLNNEGQRLEVSEVVQSFKLYHN